LNPDLLQHLARLRGIGDAYHDYRGDLRHFSHDTKADLLKAMGCDVSSPSAVQSQIEALESGRNRSLLPPIAVANSERVALEVNVPVRDFGSSLLWQLRLEEGGRRDGVISTSELPEVWRGEVDGVWITRRRFELPMLLPWGLHDLQARLSGGADQSCRLIVAPLCCHLPERLEQGGRFWGVALQLYTLRSGRNWGIGDFGDLSAVIRWLAPQGADFIALNPLHALAPGDPQRASPYSASNRNFLNIFYISLPDVPEFSECRAAIERCEAEDFQNRIGELRKADLVDYRGVAAMKLPLLKMLYGHFRLQHLDRGSARAGAFRAFVEQGGAKLQSHALFDALDEHGLRQRNGESGWQNWAADFATPDTDAVRRFARDHQELVEFHLYAQWLAHEQLLGCQALARTLGMRVGLYGDLAVGAHPSGSEVWSEQQVFRLGAEIGAPPDPLALKGQGWGIPPQDPQALERERLAPFVTLMNSNMRYYGALRFDHVMALFRQWWVPAGQSPAQGAYVHYPMHHLMSALSLASNRHGCLIVGEDLGVVPPEIREAMQRHRLLHYKVLLFEKMGDRFRAPAEFEPQALATPSTHDMPTLRSYWEGRDIELRSRLNLYPDDAVRDQVLAERERDRHALLAALRAADLAPAEPQQSAEPFTAALAEAIHVYLARSAAALVAVQIEDLLGMADPVNVPGTYWEYPNWQRKLDVSLEDLTQRADVSAALRRIDAARRQGEPLAHAATIGS
jgi:4-alpha-glucanotransferase